MPINRTLPLRDASATRSVSPSVHDTTRPSVAADHAGVNATATIAVNKIMSHRAHPTARAIARSPTQHPSERANAVLAEQNLPIAMEHQGVTKEARAGPIGPPVHQASSTL